MPKQFRRLRGDGREPEHRSGGDSYMVVNAEGNTETIKTRAEI